MKSILVTGIGGGVGQGILRNLRAMDTTVVVIGTNVVGVSAGNHLCDAVHEVPFAYEDAYISRIRELIKLHDVGLILPSTDYEAYYLALHSEELGIPVAGSPSEVSEFCLDKYANFKTFAEQGIEFARSALPSEYSGQFERTVVKPREGRGSRNIHIDPEKPADYPDEFVVQEYLDGPEFTTAFYVLQTGELHGQITLRRELENGNTSSCEVVFDHDDEIEGLLAAMVSAFPFRGSGNLQSRWTDRGIVPFEINCRISGTNSIRAQFGFPDVQWAVQELLLGRRPDDAAVVAGSAIRIMHDVIYPGRSLAAITNRHDDFRIF